MGEKHGERLQNFHAASRDTPLPESNLETLQTLSFWIFYGGFSPLKVCGGQGGGSSDTQLPSLGVFPPSPH